MTTSTQISTINIGHIIAESRRIRQFTQEELAEKAEISVKYIGDIENGRKKVSLDYFLKILVALNAGT